MKKGKFVLPNKWCVKDCEFVTNYYNETFQQDGVVDFDLHFYTFKTSSESLYYNWVQPDELKEFTVITLSQFKKYVLGIIPDKINNRKQDYKYLIPIIKEINNAYV